jgi:predicted ArsR family transcriptional regulator
MKTELLSAGEIARRLQRSRPGVRRCLARLTKEGRIKPVTIDGTRKAFPATIIPVVESSMRAPNKGGDA